MKKFKYAVILLIAGALLAFNACSKDGLSAYEIYLKYHPDYTGTEQEWIDGISGTDNKDFAEETGIFIFGKNTDCVSYVFASYEGEDRSINIPSYYNGFPVTVIGTNAFKTNHTIKNIGISKNVISIELGAFSKCYSLIDFTYEGTKEEWRQIAKAETWGPSTYIVHCSDGDIKIGNQ